MVSSVSKMVWPYHAAKMLQAVAVASVSGTKTRKWQYEPSETWSGRGKQPRWLIAALKTGHTIDEFVNRNVESNKNNFRRQRA